MSFSQIKRWMVLAAVASVLPACVRAPPPHPRALENNNLCTQYIATGDLDKADVYCDLGLQFSPFYADLWNNKGLIHLKRGNNGKAKDAFIKALRYNQEQAQAYNNLGYVYLTDKELGKAHDNFQRALKVNPDYTEARYNLALTFLRMKKYKEARKEFMTILAVNANLADPHNHLCVMDLEQANCTRAIYHCEMATQLDNNYADAWFNLGNGYSDCGSSRIRADAYTACLKADGNHVQCLNNLAIINRKIGLTDPTLKEMQNRAPVENTPQHYFMMAKGFGEKGLKYEEKRNYKKCLDLEPKYAQCHFGLFKLYVLDQRISDAAAACKNFVKFATSEEFPKQVDECEKYLATH